MIGRVLLATLALLVAGCAAAPTPTPEPTPTEAPVLRLSVGECTGDIDFNIDPLAVTIAEISCDEPHYFEVYFTIGVAQAEYPGAQALGEIASRGCEDAFKEYVGVATKYSRYSSHFLAAGEQSWANPINRNVICLAGSADGGLTGSIAGDTALFPKLGQCTGPQDVPTLDLEILDCAGEHYWEVFAVKNVKDKTAPTAEARDALIDEVCVAGFKEFVGVATAESKYEYTIFFADADTWSKIKDHRLVCTVGSSKGGITGTLKGAKK
ncbi:MAG: septum formation family protein [Propionibacteriaceae bacterium]|jgi:hypothetical protein|nr:septum formation family protein [Propionibacteriaceae bacterium]